MPSHSGKPPLLAVEDVHKEFGAVRAVAGVSLDVRDGETVALLGPNGAGKTTLIRMLVGLTRPDRGTVAYYIDGATRSLLPAPATIDDPHTSTKGSLMMLPFLPVVVAGLLFTRADTAIAQFFGVLPLTSSSVLPLRLLMAEVAPWEVPLALVLLVRAIWVLRRAAGKIFAVGMLMYGKEPTVREMWRWAREG